MVLLLLLLLPFVVGAAPLAIEWDFCIFLFGFVTADDDDDAVFGCCCGGGLLPVWL